MTPNREQLDRHLAATSSGVRHRCDDCHEVFRNAAEAYRPLALVTCPNCKGVDPALCRVCGGSGSVPPPELVAKLYPFLAHWPEPEKAVLMVLTAIYEGDGT